MVCACVLVCVRVYLWLCVVCSVARHCEILCVHMLRSATVDRVDWPVCVRSVPRNKRPMSALDFLPFVKDGVSYPIID